MLDNAEIEKLGIYDLFEMLSFCSIPDILRLSESSRSLNDLIEQPLFWRAQFRRFGLDEPDAEIDLSRAHFVKCYQAKANALQKEVNFLSAYKAELLKHFENSIDYAKIQGELNFILEHGAKLKTYTLPLNELDSILESFNSRLAQIQLPLPGWRHVELRFLTRNVNAYLAGILENTPQHPFLGDRITHVDLSNCFLEELPTSLEGFCHVESLNLYDTRLTKLPEYMLSFGSLRQLCMSGGNFDTIPHVLLQCESLHTLCIPNNQLTSLPRRSRGLENLSVLFLHDNHITEIPDGFKLDTLSQITLQGNQLDLKNCMNAREKWPNLLDEHLYVNQSKQPAVESIAALLQAEPQNATQGNYVGLLYRFNQMNAEQDEQDEALALELERSLHL